MQSNKRIIYNNIRFSSANLTYDLQFRDYFTMVAGDSGTGKTFLFNRLRDVKALKLYDRLQLYNAESENFDSIYDCSGRLIVIDNFDIVVSDRLRDFLQYDRVNQFLIFGRNTDGLPVNAESFLQLCKDNKKIYFRGVFDGLFVD